MTNETIKVLLMILIFGSLEATIHIPKIRQSRHWTFLERLITQVRSAMALTDRALQPVFLKRESSKRRALR
jgi:hypothetical protein